MSKATLIIVGGPTASGKTKLAIDIAKHFDTEIISADSRQCFQEMNIGTAKPTLEELSQVKHHFINTLSVTQEVNAGVFCEYADAVISQLSETKKYIVVTGGTGLYIKALIDGLYDLPAIPEDFRNEIKLEFVKEGLTHFVNELKAKDPVHYQTVDLNNPSRVLRAIELIRFTNQPYSTLIKKKSDNKRYNAINFCIDLPRETLYDRINQRVENMMSSGLISEVESLKKHRTQSALQTVGYVELFDFFDGKTNLAKAIELIKQHSRNYAKRQLTWFKHQGDFKMISPTLNDVISVINN